MKQLRRNRRQPRRRAMTAAARYRQVEWLEARVVLASDFGDAPVPYPTWIAENGPQHADIGPTLGGARDSEADGAHSALADADGTDEDGITFGTIQVGALATTVSVNVQNAPDGARLDAWIDFNGDGNWGGPGEQIAHSTAVVNGDNTITFNVPAQALSGSTFARFRLSTAGDLGPVGSAADGEVEDYRVTIIAPAAASGIFSDPHTIPNGDIGPAQVIAADLDSDGDMDFVAGSHVGFEICWFENDGEQNFTRHIISQNEILPTTLSTADLDGDHDLDLIITSYASNTISWLENDGSQNFTLRTIHPDTQGFVTPVIVDMDGDGDLDLLGAVTDSDAIHWLENDGQQNFTPHLIGPIGSNSNTNVTAVAAADVDNDGDLDAIAASGYNHSVTWYENDGDQSFTVHTITTTAVGVSYVLATDLDGDGDIDLVAAASSPGGSVVWYENDGQQEFTAHTIADDAYLTLTSAVDVDGDGDQDLIATSIDGSDKTFSWLENEGAGTFTRHDIRTFPGSFSGGASEGVPADVDGDGDLDIVASSPLSGGVLWLENLNSVNLSVSTTSGSEAGTTVITVTATADRPVTENATFALSVTGTGISAGDYTLSSRFITILSGQTAGSVTFVIKNDTLIEGTETAILTLTRPLIPVIGTPSDDIVLGPTTTQEITIADNDKPTIITSATAIVPENTPTSTVILDVNVVLSSISNANTLTYSLTGVDSTLFSIDAAGKIYFLTSPDYDAPADQDGDNIYHVTVVVTANVDPAAVSTQDLAITVIPAPQIVVPEEPGTYVISKSATLISPASTFAYDNVANPDFGGSTLTVSITRGRSKKDVLSILPEGSGPEQINVKGHKVLVGDTVIGTFKGGKGKHGDLVIRLTHQATVAVIGNLLHTLSFQAKNNPDITRTISVQITNIQGVDSNLATRDFSVVKNSSRPS